MTPYTCREPICAPDCTPKRGGLHRERSAKSHGRFARSLEQSHGSACLVAYENVSLVSPAWRTIRTFNAPREPSASSTRSNHFRMPVVAAAPVSLTVKGIGGQLVTPNVGKARIATKTRVTLRNIPSGSRVLPAAPATTLESSPAPTSSSSCPTTPRSVPEPRRSSSARSSGAA